MQKEKKNYHGWEKPQNKRITAHDSELKKEKKSS
jgi:hypothetical protein